MRDVDADCAKIESLSVPSATERTGVLDMVQEACDQVSVLGEHYVPDSHSKSTAELQDLKEYFRRPVLIASGNTTLNALTNLTAGSINSTTLPNLFTSFANRLTGIAGLSFDIVFTLQVSASPFSQGLMALCWQYDVGVGNSLNRTNLPTFCTNLPHVRLDISENTMVQLRVPFLNAQQFFDLRNSFSYGSYGLNAILPIRVGQTGFTPPAYHLLVHLENLKLFGAAPLDTVNINFQAGGKSPIEQEFEQEAYPFSSGIHALSRTVKWISKGVPSLSSIGGPTSWFLGKVAGAVRAFGYAKPLVQEPSKRIWSNATIMEHNVDVPSSALMVGSLASNRLKVDANIASSDVDEMSMAYVLQQWGQLSRFNFDNTNVVQDILWATPVSPACFWYKGNVSSSAINRNPPVEATTSNGFIPTHLFWWGQCFKQWRGDIEFRFTFSKTKMHGGRVIVGFNPISGSGLRSVGPGSAAVSLPIVNNNPTFAYSAIFDLKDNNVFTFTVPYFSTIGYTDFYQHIGTVCMRVYDPLIWSTVTAANIQCLVEVRAKPDFEFAIPRSITYVPGANNTTPLYQSGVVSAITSDISEQAVGENITSVKQLISVPTILNNMITNYFSASPIAASSSVVNFITPWFTRQQFPTAAAANTIDYTVLPPRHFNFAAYACNAYLYARGSTDIHVNTVGGGDLGFIAYQLPSNRSLNIYDRSVGNMMAWLSGKVGHFRFPGYQYAVRSSLPSCQTATTSAITFPSNLVSNQYQCAIKLINTSASTAYYQTRIAAGDDAMLGHYVGPTYLAIPSTSANLYDNTSTYLETGGTTAGAVMLPTTTVDDATIDTSIDAAQQAEAGISDAAQIPVLTTSEQ